MNHSRFSSDDLHDRLDDLSSVDEGSRYLHENDSIEESLDFRTLASTSFQRNNESSSIEFAETSNSGNILTYLYIPYPILITYPYNPTHKTFVSVFSSYEIENGGTRKSIIQPTLITIAPPHLIVHTTDSPKPSRYPFELILNRKNVEPEKVALSLNGLFFAFLLRRDLIIWNINEKKCWGTHRWSRSRMEVINDSGVQSSFSLSQMVMRRMSVRGLMGGYFDDDSENSSKESRLQDCYWLLNDHLIVISTYSAELYKLDYSQKILTKLKTFYSTSKQIIYTKFSNHILIIYEGKHVATVFHLDYISSTGSNFPSYSISKPSKIQFDVSSKDNFVYPEEISIHQIYNKSCILYICTKKQELSVFRSVEQYFTRKLTYNLFGAAGKYLVNVIDSLIFVHNVEDKLTMCYDIRWRERKPCAVPMCMDAYSTSLSDFKDNLLRSFRRDILGNEDDLNQSKTSSNTPGSPHPDSIMSDRDTILVDEAIAVSEISTSSLESDSIKDFPNEAIFRKKNMSSMDYESHYSDTDFNDVNQVRLYSKHWKAIEPNFIFDISTGCLFQLQFSLKDLQSCIRTNSEYLKFLLRRADGKQLFLDKFREIVQKGESIYEIKTILYDTNRRLKSFLKFKKNLGIRELGEHIQYPFPVINQTDIYSSILHPLEILQTSNPSRLINITIEYIHSLAELFIPIEPFLQKVLIQQLIENNDFGLLHEFVQYKVISDSKETATMIYRLSKKYPPAFQIAMDMLSRLKEYETMSEFLLDCGNVLHAIKMIHDHSIQISYEVVFEAVLKKKDIMLFYNAYEILRVLNKRTRGDAKFIPSDKISNIEEKFMKLFKNDN